MSGDILFEAVIFLAAAIICVPVAKKFGLSSVLGYLIAGIAIGPYVLDFVAEEGEDILHFAEFGVVMMLFLIGLELDPKSFWKMRRSIVGMGGLQVFLTMVVICLLMVGIGVSWEVSLVVSMAVALSSTAIVLQTLKERGLFNTTYGASSFSILLFQDIIFIPMLAAIPLLTSGQPGVGRHHGEGSFLESLPLAVQAFAILFSVMLVILAGRYFFVPMLRLVANTRLRELFSASALLIVFVIAYLMEMVGLSPALGAFLGGVVLATSEFKHELESNLEPFKGLLLGLFFIAVGASINFLVIAENPFQVGAMVAGVVLIKAMVLYVVASLFKIKTDQKLLIMVGLAQIGEFAFVLLSFAFQLDIISRDQLDLMLVVAALTMTLTPILNIINERLILPRVGTRQSEQHDMDHIAKSQKVILVGFGDFGSTIGRFLRANGVEATILDHDSNRVDLLRKMGFEVYYGDASREDLLVSAGIEEAEILIIAIDDADVTIEMVKMIHEKYPHIKLLVRARSRGDAYELHNMGVLNIYRETLDTSVKLAADVLYHMGMRKYTVHRQAQNFIKYDEENLKKLAEEPQNSEKYIFKAKELIALESLQLNEDLKRGLMADDHLWDSEQMRNPDGADSTQ